MKTIIPPFMKTLFQLKWGILAVTLFLFNLLHVIPSVFFQAGDKRLSLNSWDLFFFATNDIYKISYFILPILIFCAYKYIEKDFEFHILIRQHAYKNWIIRGLKQYILNIILPFLFVWFSVDLITMLGVPFSWHWSSYALNMLEQNLPAFIASVFHYPLIGLVTNFLFAAISSGCLYLFLAVCYVYWQSKFKLLLLSGTLSVLFGILFKLLPKHLSFLNFAQFFSLAHPIEAGIFKSGLTFFVAIILLLWAMYGVDRKKERKFNFIKNYGLILLYLLCCLSGFFTMSSKMNANAPLIESLTLNFMGVSGPEFIYLDFLLHLVVFFGFVYFVQLYFSREVTELSYYPIIRYKNMHKWFMTIWGKTLKCTLLFILTMFFLSFLSGFYFTSSWHFMLPSHAENFKILYHYFVNGFLQINFYVLSSFLLFLIFNNPSFNLLMIGVCFILLFTGLNQFLILPVGLNSLSFVFDKISVIAITASLIVWNVVVLVTIHFSLKKSLNI